MNPYVKYTAMTGTTTIWLAKKAAMSGRPASEIPISTITIHASVIHMEESRDRFLFLHNNLSVSHVTADDDQDDANVTTS